MNRQLSRLLSFGVNIAAALLAACVVLFRQDWFGSGDIKSFLFWTVPLAIGVSVSGDPILNLLRTKRTIVDLATTVVAATSISVGWTFAVSLLLGPWVGAFSIPVGFLWIFGTNSQLLFHLWRFPPRSPDKSRKRAIYGVAAMPVVLTLSVVLVYLSAAVWGWANRPTPETFNLPAGFSGPFRVVYGEPCGIQPRQSDGRQVIDVPENGLAIVKPALEYGVIDHKYYMMEGGGKRLLPDSPGLEPTWVELRGTGSLGRPTENGYSSESPLAIHYSDFIVHASGDAAERERPHVDTASVVETCRSANSTRFP